MVSGHASGEAVVGVTITFTIIAAASTALRLYTRFVIVKSTGLDDAFIAAAMVRAHFFAKCSCPTRYSNIL